MPVSLAVGDIASFRKYVKYIGRAYQKRSVAMIQLCRLFLEISPGKPDQIDALRSLFEAVEDALKSAVDAGKDRSDAADTAFATAEEALDWYAAWHHPKQQEVLGDVQDIIEDAAQKDSYIAKTHKRLSTRLGFNKSDSLPTSSLVKVHFQILQSPTDRREAPVVTCELGPDVKISELLWTFSRLPEDQRISLKQNPHFYFSKDLSDQASAYDDQFKLEPLKDLRPMKDLVVMVLLDRAGQIFVDYQQFSKTYGNIWRPNNTIILKDLQGTLEAATLISPKLDGEVCIWQRGGGRTVEEDLSKWTEILERALDMPDVDWLIRSETSPDEAFDIEVTGGWERCSPISIPNPPGLSKMVDPITITPPCEDALIPPEDAPSPVSLLSTMPTVGAASQEPFHLSQDAPPLSVTVELSPVEVQGIAEECPSAVEDKDILALDISSLAGSIPSTVDDKGSSALDISSPSGSTSAPAEAILPSVNPASTPLEPFMSPEESEPALANGTSSPERTVPMAAESTCSHDEAVHTQIPLTRSFSNPLTLPTDSTVASTSLNPQKNAPADDTKASHPPVQLAFVRPESTPPSNRSELALASSAPTPEKIPEPPRPQAEATRAPDHLRHSTSDRPIPSIGDNVAPESVVPVRSRTTTSDSTLSQAEAIHRPNTSSKPLILAGTVPVLNRTAPAPAPVSNTTPLRFKLDRSAVQAVRSPEHLVPLTENRSTSPSGVPAPNRIPPFSGRARSGSRSGAFRQPLVTESPPALSASPGLSAPPIGSKQAHLTGVARAPHVNPPSSESVRTPVEAARPPNQNFSASSKPRVSSVVACNVPTFHNTAQPMERTHIQVEAQTPRPPVRPTHVPPRSGPRTSVGSHLPSLNGVAVPDMRAAHLSSRSRIKSHPKKMVTYAGQRRSAAFSTQINVQPAARPSGPPVEHSTANLGPSHATQHTTLVGSQYHGASLENRGGYQSYTTRRGQVNVSISVSAPAASNGTTRMSSQDPMGQSRRSTVVTRQISSQLPAPRTAEKFVPNTVPNRNSVVPVARQDRTAGALSHSSHAKSSNLVAIPEGQGALKGYSVPRSATPTTSHPAAEKPNSSSSLQSIISRTSSIVNMKDPTLQTRKSIVLPEQTTSKLAARLQPGPIVSSVPSSNPSDPVTMARLGKTTEAPSHGSRVDISTGVAGATEFRGGFSGHSVGPKVLPLPPFGGAAAISASPMWNNTARTSSRIKTKDLISRHKQQNVNDVRPTSTAESASPSQAPTSALSQTATLVGKSSVNRIDSGIELWDYDPQGATPDRRRSHDTSTNGHGSPSRDRGSSSADPTSSPIGTKTNNRKDGTRTSLSSKRSRMSMLGSPSPAVSLSQPGIPMSSTPPEQVKNPLLKVTTGSSSTGSLTSTAAGRREPFINRKPQPTSQSTSHSGAGSQSGFFTPPRSSTPSSVSHSGSSSTRATMVTPATSFTIPSRVPSPVAEVGSKSWFRRNVIDAVKSKLGYGS